MRNNIYREGVWTFSSIYIYIRICSLGILCGWVLCMRASEPVRFNPVGFGCRVWVCASHCHENPSASNNFKRRSVEQLKGTCYVMFSTLLGNPSFHHLTILIPCYLKSHSYIFFCKYFMFRSVLFGFQIFGVGSVLFGCKYREAMKTILPYGWNRAVWNHFLETLETLLSLNSFNIINS